MRFPFIILTVCFVVFGLGAASADDKPIRRTISMSGTGEINAKPDIAYISSGVISQAKTAGEAMDQNSKAMEQVIATLKNAAIADKDIQTSSFSVQPQYFYDKKNRRRPPEIIGYQVSNQVTVTVRDLTKLGGVLDKMVTVGANRLGNIRFSIANPKPLLNEARKLATAEAINKAKLYAEAAGVKLGIITSIRESSVRQPQPRTYARAMAAAPARRPVPVQAGEQKTSVRVTLTWTLE